RLSFDDFRLIFWERSKGRKVKIPRAMEDAFLAGDSPEEMAIAALIREHRAAETVRLEQELFAQRTRLADAERKLAEKTTKAASESKRIALNKIEAYRKALAGQVEDSGARIYPHSYAPVVIVQDGQRVVVPMRYLCRPAGAPLSFDKEFDGCYNAFRTSLTVS
ncbi:MAG: hypothetical protein WBH52_22895, partial [Pseudomonas aeruginosa]